MKNDRWYAFCQYKGISSHFDFSFLMGLNIQVKVSSNMKKKKKNVKAKRFGISFFIKFLQLYTEAPYL